MTITVNGETERHDEETLTVRRLLEKKRYSFPLIIIRVNGALVDRADYDSAPIRDGNDIDLYHLVSGG